VTGAERAVAELGRLRPPKGENRVLLEVEQGAADIPRVVRALDEAGIGVESLELVRPTLDDVFVAKTGHHLEGEEGGEGTEAVDEPEAEAAPA
jgi:ABC-2 type transport system ATP-binding protein